MAADRLSERNTSLTPPSSHSAPCTPAASASKLSLAATICQRQPLYESANSNSRCANGSPPMVTPKSLQLVKSKAASRPGRWSWEK